jgi:hypothetical protein
MHSPIDRLDADLFGEALGRGLEPVVLGGVDDMVNSHAVIVAQIFGCS